MKTNFTIKRLVSGIIVFTLGLMTLLTLCIPFTRVDALGFSETGFSLFDFSFDEMRGASGAEASIIGILSIFQLLVSIATMVFAVVIVFFFSDGAAKKLTMGLSITCLVFTFLYMLIGIIACSIYTTYYVMGVGFPTSTLAYLGFIFAALLFAAYVVCGIVMKEGTASDRSEKTEAASATPVPRNAERVTSAKDIAESLKQYKELLDSGIITQEEFDEKKNEILKGN